MNFLDFREPVSALSHCAGLLLSIPATVVLWRKCGNDLPKRLSVLVFGVTLGICYLGSTMYHGVRGPQGTIDVLDRFDHVGIHLLIAGSYTPLAWNMMRGRARFYTLGLVWAAAVLACSLLLLNLRLPSPLETAGYLVIGWGAIFCYFEIARRVTHRSLRLLVIGGVLYSIGAVLNVMHWPMLWPGVVGPHEVFHFWVLAGSLAHFWFLFSVVVPFVWASEAKAAPSASPVWVGGRGRGNEIAPRRPFAFWQQLWAS